MSAAVATSPKAAKSTKKVSKDAKKPASHPTYSDMIKKAVTELKEKGGSSKAAILKYILSNYKVGDNVTQINAHLRLAIKRAVVKGDLKQTKGTGASGSFKLGEKKAAAPKKVAKKPAAKKAPKSPKKAAAKKPKSPKKKAAAKPKTAAKKAASKPKSPKKKTAAKPKKAAPKKA